MDRRSIPVFLLVTFPVYLLFKLESSDWSSAVRMVSFSKLAKANGKVAGDAPLTRVCVVGKRLAPSAEAATPSDSFSDGESAEASSVGAAASSGPLRSSGAAIATGDFLVEHAERMMDAIDARRGTPWCAPPRVLTMATACGLQRNAKDLCQCDPRGSQSACQAIPGSGQQEVSQGACSSLQVLMELRDRC